MNLQEWREKQTEAVALPSGLDVTLRKVDFLTLISLGVLPGALMAKLMELEGKQEIEPSELPEYIALFDEVARYALIEPLVGETADETHITLNELSMEDKIAIFKRVNRNASGLAEKFRGDAGDGDDAVAGA